MVNEMARSSLIKVRKNLVFVIKNGYCSYQIESKRYLNLVKLKSHLLDDRYTVLVGEK